MLMLAAGSTPEFLSQIAALVVGGAVVAYVGLRLNIVPIVAFLLTGVVIGPNALGVVSDLEIVNAAAEVGVLLLLFTIGLEFSLDRLKELRRPLFVGGGLQVFLATMVTFGVLLAAGVDANVALFSGLLVSLSSTAIVLKLLADRAQVGSEHGRLAVSVLLFQDLAVVAMVLLVPVLGESGGSPLDIVQALGIAVAIIAVVIVGARRLLPPVLERVARTCSPELFLLTVVAICIGTAYLTSLAGVSVSLGAFLAGLVVSESRFSSQALGEILPLQIIFSATFFVSIGMLLDLGFLVDHLPLVLGAVLALLVVKAVTATAAMLALRARLGVALAAGLTLAQVGEFSFVLATAGAAEGLTPAGLGADGTQGFIAATVLLMAATPGLSAFGARLGARMAPAEATDVLTGRAEPVPGGPVADDVSGHVLIAGYGQWARGITRVLRDRGVPLVVTTLSPEGATDAHELGVPVLLGDPARTMTLTEAGIARAKVVIVPDDGAERAAQVVGVVRALDPDICVIVRARYAEDEAELLAAGATHVVTEELAASALLLTKLFRAFGRELGDALVEAKTVAQYHEASSAPRAARSASHGTVDTEAPVEVELGGAACAHIGPTAAVVPGSAGCEECLRSGDSWVHLRVCLTCGHVGCCDSSPNRHARAHHEREGHHVVRSAEPGESWVYCFADDRMLAERTDEPATRTR